MLSFSPIEKPKIDIERSGLFENIASTSEGIQTIVIENEIPEIDYSNVNLIHFTKNANTGRYGFLIDVMD